MSIAIKRKHSIRFDRWSKVYDKSILQNIVFNKTHRMFLREMLPFLKKGFNILDIGCGTGRFAFRLSEISRGINIFGIDISKDMIEKARGKLRGEPIDFRVGDVEDLPYESHTFDIITCSNSFHHYPNQKKAVSEMYRVLKPGGRLMIVDGSRDNLVGKVIFGITQIMEGDVYHIFELELKDMLHSMGFDGVTQKRFNPLAPLLYTQGHAKKEETE